MMNINANHNRLSLGGTNTELCRQFVVSKEGTKIPNVSPYLVDRKPTFMPRDVCRSMVRAFYEAKASRTLAGLRTGM